MNYELVGHAIRFRGIFYIIREEGGACYLGQSLKQEGCKIRIIIDHNSSS
jgi:hypothetical protein